MNTKQLSMSDDETKRHLFTWHANETSPRSLKYRFPKVKPQPSIFRQILIENGAAVDAEGDNDYTPLHTAATNGFSDIVTVREDRKQ